MKFLFDYTFYFFVKWHNKREGIEPSNGVLAVTFYQFLYLIQILGITFYVFDYDIHVLNKYIVVGFGVILYIINYFTYRNKYEILEKKWENDTRKSRILKNIIIFTFMILGILLLGFIPEIK